MTTQMFRAARRLAPIHARSGMPSLHGRQIRARLHPGTEQIAERYHAWHPPRGSDATPDGQRIADTGYDRDRERADVPASRLHGAF